MRVEQRRWSEGRWEIDHPAYAHEGFHPQLLLFFGDRRALEDGGALAALAEIYPGVPRVGCSTAGEISGTRVYEGTVVATALELEGGEVRIVQECLADAGGSEEAGRRLGDALEHAGLRHVLLFSPGLDVNGSELARGITERIPRGVAVTGGLAGDGSAFGRTLVQVGNGVEEREVVAVGFYGEGLKVGHGSLGGWDTFGPDRLITRSRGNVLFELDGQPALELYRRYLGPHAANLPASGLLFPLSLLQPETGERVVRTILGVDDAVGSLTFAGDVPEGRYARLMKANFDRLVEGAAGAASASLGMIAGPPPAFALLISCVGRRLVLNQRVEEEVESVRDVLGPDAVLSGFYSYGEISPHAPSARCELHNQTMTITTFTERP